ncbi:MAG TPA: hypothetical protein DCS55_01255 [Acidimicrobiaceae bacterium]|nr:hypothetical protein [Acidimicrobiaceae bacterium]
MSQDNVLDDLRAYVSVLADDVSDAVETPIAHDPQPQGGRRLMLAAAAAVVVLALAAGGLALVAGNGDESTTFAGTGEGTVNAAEGMWTPMAASPLTERFDPVTLWTGTELLVWGGYDMAGDEYADGAAYDPAADRWRPMADMPFEYEAREGVGPGEDGASTTYSTPRAWHDGRAYFVVASASELWAWDLVAYEPESDAWQLVDGAQFDQMPDDALVARSGTATVQSPSGLASVDGTLWVYGWHSQRGEFGWASFAPATGEWGEFSGIPGSGELYGFAGVTPAPVVVDDRYLVWLREPARPDGLPLGYSIDVVTGNVATVDVPVEAESLVLDGLTDAGVMVGLAISSEGQAERVAFALDPSTGDLTPVPPPPAGPADEDAAAALIAVDGSTVLVGGVASEATSGGLGAESVALALDASAENWEEMPSSPIDLSRTAHLAVWTGDRLIVWGGVTTAGVDDNRLTVPLGDGALFAPQGARRVVEPSAPSAAAEGGLAPFEPFTMHYRTVQNGGAIPVEAEWLLDYTSTEEWTMELVAITDNAGGMRPGARQTLSGGVMTQTFGPDEEGQSELVDGPTVPLAVLSRGPLPDGDADELFGQPVEAATLHGRDGYRSTVVQECPEASAADIPWCGRPGEDVTVVEFHAFNGDGVPVFSRTYVEDTGDTVWEFEVIEYRRKQ